MSVRTMARVWEHSKQSGTHLLMLLAIADFADDEGNAYPAVPTLAKKCRMKPRNANVVLAALRASGELVVRQNEGPRGANRYRINLSDGVQERAGVQAFAALQGSAGVQERAGMQSLARTPAKACPKPLQGFADEPSVNHQEPSGVRALAPAHTDRASRKNSKRAELTHAEWLDTLKGSGEKVIENYRPFLDWFEASKLPGDFVRLWLRAFAVKMAAQPKRQADWRRTMLTYLREGWAPKLWRHDARSNCWVLTDAGVLAAREHGFGHLLGVDEAQEARAA